MASRAGTVIAIEGTFDDGAARAVRARFLKGATHVTLDFRRTREISDSALAVLAGQLAKEGPPAVSVRGLTVRQERMLRYLGARIAALPKIDDADPKP